MVQRLDPVAVLGVVLGERTLLRRETDRLLPRAAVFLAGPVIHPLPLPWMRPTTFSSDCRTIAPLRTLPWLLPNSNV